MNTDVQEEQYEEHGAIDSFRIDYAKIPQNFSMTDYHAHGSFEILYTLFGQRTFLVEDKVFTMSKGDIIFIRSSALHKSLARGIPGYERLVVYFTREFLGPEQALLEDGACPFNRPVPILSLNVGQQKEMEELLFKMFAEFRKRDQAYISFVKAKLVELLVFSLRCSEASAAEPVRSTCHLLISDIAGYIRQHYQSEICLSDLAARFAVSPYYLSRLFKSTTGFSFLDYLHAIRVRQAQMLLRESGRKVTDVASEVGFDDLSYFAKVFRKYSGCTPLQYRKSNGMEPKTK